MARTTDTLRIDVLFEVRKATKELAAMARQVKKGTDKMEKGFKKANRGINKMSAGMKQFRTLAISAFSLFAIRDFIRASNKQEAAIQAMNSALEQTGIFSEALSNNLKILASDIQKITTEADESTIANIALMQNIGRMGSRVIPEATRAAIGLAKIMKVDAKTAFMLVGRAAAGSFELFTQYGIMLDMNASKQEKFNQLMRMGGKAFKIATDEVLTGAGKMKQWSNSITGVKEKVGDLIKEALIPMDKEIRVLIQGLELLIKFFRATMLVLEGVAGVAYGIIQTFVKSARTLTNNFIEWTVLFFTARFSQAGDVVIKTLKSVKHEFQSSEAAITLLIKNVARDLADLFKKEDPKQKIDDIVASTDGLTLRIEALRLKFRPLGGMMKVVAKDINFLLNESVKNLKLSSTNMQTFIDNWRSLGDTISFVFEQAAFAGKNFFETLLAEVNRLAQAIISRAAIFAILNLIPGVGPALRGPGQFILGNPLGIDLAGKRSAAPNISNMTINFNSSVNNASKKWFRDNTVPLIQGAVRDGRLNLNGR